MSFFKKISDLFSSGGGSPSGDAYWVTVKCNRCGEVIRTRINLNNDLSLNYDDGGSTTYYCRKLLMGEQRCFQRIEVELTFDNQRRPLRRDINGGTFIDEV
jgi:hypothetical protein